MSSPQELHERDEARRRGCLLLLLVAAVELAGAVLLISACVNGAGS